jgi:hypothetical protein
MSEQNFDDVQYLYALIAELIGKGERAPQPLAL